MFVSIHEVSYFAKHCVCVCVCVYVFWKCCFLFWIFRFDLCFYRDMLAKEVVQLMTETDKIKTSINNSEFSNCDDDDIKKQYIGEFRTLSVVVTQ